MKEKEKKDCKIISIEEWRKKQKEKEEQKMLQAILKRGNPLDKK